MTSKEREAQRKPLPSGVTELLDTGVYSLVELPDGSLLSNNGRSSNDGGTTWSEPEPFALDSTPELLGASGHVMLRLEPGALVHSVGGKVWVSRDSGRTWGPGVDAFPGVDGLHFLGNEMIQMESGRLIYPGYISFGSNSPEFKYEDVLSRGLWRGTVRPIEGHHHLPELYVGIMAYSDDEGVTWQSVLGRTNSGKPRRQTFYGWFDELGIPNGQCGVLPFGECTVADAGDNNLLMFGRSTVNRVLHTRSSDGGDTWSSVLPTELANSGSPPRLKRIPKTGDQLCVWNQVSREEVQRGYRRGRLSAAISKDGGHTWENFKTIELSDGLTDIDRVACEYPIKMVRARDYVGCLPDGWSYAHYANVSFAGEFVYVSYRRCSPSANVMAEQDFAAKSMVLRIYPLEWFYE